MDADGLCECGCGARTSIATQTRTADGIRKGEPVRFLRGHQGRLAADRGPAWIEDADTGCWLWQKSHYPNGYGYRRRTDNGITITQAAHRWVYEQHHGEIPDGLELDHLCRTPACVNPDHLEPVTHTENVRRGLAARLTADDVVAIRSATRSYGYLIRLGEQFGVAPVTIRNIRARRVWKTV